MDFHNALVRYYTDCESNPKAPISTYIGECVMKIAEKYSTKVNFFSYTYREELIGDAVEKMIEAVVLRKYDPVISQNPFAYFSQITWNCFLQRIKEEKKQSYISHKNFENMFSTGGEDDLESLMADEHHIKIIDDFEKPKDKGNYVVHKNLSYARNREKKKKVDKTIEE